MLSRTQIAAGAALLLLAPLAARAQTPPAAEAPAAAAATAAAPASPNLAAAGDMMATLSANPHFSTLVAALKATNLAPVLAATPQLTLFAPTNEAFAALPANVQTALMNPNNLPLLQKLLTYHLIHVDLDQAKLKGAKGGVPTVAGPSVDIDGFSSTPKVGDADILQDGVHATNGWLYPVDKVLVPPGTALPTS